MSYSTNDALGGLDRIYTALLSELNGVPMPVLQMSVFDAIEEFCRRSIIWRQTLQFTMAPGIARVDLNPVDDNTLVAWILWVYGPQRWMMRPPALLIDLGDTSTDRRGSCLVACKPARLDTYDVPDFIVSDWGMTIRNGAKGRLLAMPNRPWSDPKAAEFYERRFRGEIFLAKETVRRQGDLPRPGFPYFARGNQGVGGVGQIGGIAPQEAPVLLDSALSYNDGEADVDGNTFDSPVDSNDVGGEVF